MGAQRGIQRVGAAAMQTEDRGQPWNTDGSLQDGAQRAALAWPLSRRHLCVLALLVLGSLPFGQPAFSGVALGGLLSLINLRLLERSVANMLGAPGGPNGLAMRLFLHMRLLLLFGLVVFVLVRVKLPLIPFTIGLSSAVPSVLWHGWQTRER